MALIPFLSSHGILGLNARNLLYLKPFNPRKAVAFADDKLKTKLFLSTRAVPVPRVYATIPTRAALRAFPFGNLPETFVLKPNYGYGGEGIIVVTGRRKGKFLTKGKDLLSVQDLYEHIEDILDGKFSVNGRMDTAFFEEMLIAHDCFAPFRPAGLPDIRVVCFNLVPVMAMLRIPTAESEGKANMHLGGIGIGIDIAKGTTTFAAQRNKPITALPHGGSFSGIQIPHWDEILLVTSRIQQVTNIGYLAADITIDAEGGPKLLEVNARAGLSVQIANLAPLRSRLERVSGLHVASPEKGVLLGKELFGSGVRKVSPRTTPTVGLYDVISIPLGDSAVEVACTVSTEHDRTAFSFDLISELLGRGALDVENREEGTYRVRFTLAGRKLQTIVVGKDLSDLDVRVSLGRRDLKGFLIDPSRGREVVRTPKRARLTVDLLAVDRQLAHYAREMPFLRALRPMNVENHFSAAREDEKYEPVFTYEPLTFDIDEVSKHVKELKVDGSPFGTLLKRKREELLHRIAVLQARGDTTAFTAASIALFGKPTDALTADARTMLDGRDLCLLPSSADDLLSARRVQERFRAVLQQYALHDWEVQLRPDLLSDCAVGGRTIFLREGAMFEQAHVEALIAHEIEAHVLTAENAALQPYQILRIGCAEYLDTQEGLAVYLQNRVLPPGHDKRYWAPRAALGVAFSLLHNFHQTRQYLERIGYTPEKALRKTFALKRGLGDTSVPGAFTKDVVYFRGLRILEDFVNAGGDLKRLYIGRIALPDLALIEKLPGLRPALLLPRSLR